jgi:membrane associated rhomboid family serine protease
VIPLRDLNRSQTQPHVTRILLIINIVVFIVVLLPEFASSNWIFAFLGLSDSPSLDEAFLNYGMIPYFILRGQNLYTLFTSMFLHADIWHIGGNMLFLYVFGDNIEDAFGHVRYLAFYFISGLTADLAFIGTQLLSSDPTALLIPTIGASGAIAGVLGAYLILYPRARILTLIFIGWVFIVPLPAILFLGFWFIYQLIYSMLALGVEAATGIAYWAHIGGFVAGIFFGLVWRGRKLKQPLY